jgi:flagellar motor switch protein FliM
MNSESMTEERRADMADPWSEMMRDVETRLVDVNRDVALSDDEIDRLMGLISEGDDKAGKTAVAEAAVVASGLAPMVRVIAEAFVERLSRSLRHGIAGLIDVSSPDVTLNRLSTLIGHLPMPSAMAVMTSRGVTGAGLVVADAALASAFFDVMLGGGQAREVIVQTMRPYSAFELKLFRQFSEYAAKAFSEAVGELMKVEFIVDKIETNPNFLNIGKPIENAIRLSVHVLFGRRGGRLDLILPVSLFGAHPVVVKTEEDHAQRDLAVWRQHFVQSVAKADLELEALLAEFKMPLRRVMSLAVGQTIPLSIDPSSAIVLQGGGKRLAVGHMGRSRHHVAIRLAGPVAAFSNRRSS